MQVVDTCCRRFAIINECWGRVGSGWCISGPLPLPRHLAMFPNGVAKVLPKVSVASCVCSLPCFQAPFFWHLCVCFTMRSTFTSCHIDSPCLHCLNDPIRRCWDLLLSGIYSLPSIKVFCLILLLVTTHNYTTGPEPLEFQGFFIFHPIYTVLPGMLMFCQL